MIQLVDINTRTL